MPSEKSERITLIPLSKLKKWEKNYRVGNVSTIVGSISQFGFNSALRVWRGTIYAGNHSYEALSQMKANEVGVPAGILETNGEWLVPCIDISHLSRLEAEAFGVADNHTSDLAENDPERLSQILAEIAAADGALFAATGFTDIDLKELLSEVDVPDFGAATEEEQGRLDSKKPIQCPECGHEFVPPSK